MLRALDPDFTAAYLDPSKTPLRTMYAHWGQPAIANTQQTAAALLSASQPTRAGYEPCTTAPDPLLPTHSFQYSNDPSLCCLN